MHHSFAVHVALISHDYFGDVAHIHMFRQIIQPFFNVFERLSGMQVTIKLFRLVVAVPICDIKNAAYSVCSSIIRACDGAISFLPRRVPDLHLHLAAGCFYLADLYDALQTMRIHSSNAIISLTRKSTPIVAMNVSLNTSSVWRCRIEVLPTCDEGLRH